jgi:hypothetical protein
MNTHLGETMFRSIGCVLAISAGLAIVAPLVAQDSPEPKDTVLGPFMSRQEAEEFLRTAEIVKLKGELDGVTNPLRLTLDNGRIEHDAIYKRIDDRKFGVSPLGGTSEFDFKDSWKFEVAAYELDKLLSLNMVPVTVERIYERRHGSLQLWVYDCMPESERVEKKMRPPNPVAWNQKVFKIRIFDRLIYNIDRHLSNLLITPDWRPVMIDHSRAFKSLPRIFSPERMQYFSLSLMDALAKLDKEVLEEKLGDYLTSPEIKQMLVRRDMIFELYEKRLEKEGKRITYP